MRKVGSVAVAAALAIAWLGGCAVQPVPAGSAAASAGATVGPRVEPGVYLVRTVWKDAPLSKARIEWRHHLDDATPALSGDTSRFGTVIFRPATASYYLTAEWRADADYARPRKPGDRFAWFGRNPLLVSAEAGGEFTLILEGIPPPPPPRAAAGTGVNGRVTLGGVPVVAAVYAYAESGTGFKGNDFQATARTGANGDFTLELPPGRYYLLARQRADNVVDAGPMRKGELLGYDPMNPVVVVEGRFVPSAIPVTRLMMIKSLVESPAFKVGTIEGRIVDRNGRPTAGVYAMLYDNPMMIGRPVFLSETTGDDGKFRLPVPVPGRYFLSARSGYGGPPTAGGWFGAWGGSTDHSIAVKAGERRAGVEIIVERLTRDMRTPGSP